MNPCGQMGGAEASLKELLASLRRAEPEWELSLLLGENGPLAEKARELGVNVFVEHLPAPLARVGDAGGRRPNMSWSMLKAALAAPAYVRRLAAICRTIRPDIIHTNGFKMHVLGTWSRQPGSAVIWHVHDYVSARPLMKRALRQMYGRCTCAIANSHSVAHDVAALFPGLNVVPIYNAINLERFSPVGDKADLDALAGLPQAPDGTIRVGLVATFARWKGHMVFLRALSLLRRELPIRGYIVGGPIYQTVGSQFTLRELRKEVKQLGLSECVGFTGFMADTSSAIRSLDVVVHASTAPEPFGLTIIEAMACGKPVIVSKAGGATELFREEQTGLGHVAGDAQSLARQIERLVCSASLRSSLGDAARIDVAQRFHGGRMAARIVDLYRDCHAAGRASFPIRRSA